MKRYVAGAIILAAVGSIVAISCMDRQPKPVCPVPTEVSSAESAVTTFDGVDLLVVVDDSGSMKEEQDILATGFFTLINSLANPTAEWPYDAVENIRVGITTSDMGLQYGGGNTDNSPSIPRCDGVRDDGEFQEIIVSVVPVASGVIACDKGGGQCPADFTCQAGGGGQSFCVASSDPYSINCTPPMTGDWAETEAKSANPDLATQVACLGVQGKVGCGIEQQLQAAPRALERQGKEFLVGSHLLAVLIVSDEEDCSIQYDGLFNTDEWESGGNYVNNDPATGHLNTSCNLPEVNETRYLFPPETYYNALVEAKGGVSGAVIFAAIVGVPIGDTCEGKGTEIGDCLSDPDMQLAEQLFDYEGTGGQYFHFAPACERSEGKTIVTTARPGRRYVQVAEEFGSNSYIYSICNADWSPAMASIAEVIAQAIKKQCYPKALEWQLVPEGQAPDGCNDCGAAKCDMISLIQDNEDFPACPAGLTEIGQETLDTGYFQTACRIEKIPTPRYCDQAADYVDHAEVGWYYCENLNYENFEEACSDNIDNDGVNGVDCADPSCADCPSCKQGKDGGTCVDTCTYAVEMTDKTKELTLGTSVTIQCLQQFTFEDENCQENTKESCIDNEDNDGNGVWDCVAGDDHLPDPHCCPLKVNDDNSCTPVGFADICEGVPVKDNDPNSDTVCEAHARALNCTLE